MDEDDGVRLWNGLIQAGVTDAQIARLVDRDPETIKRWHTAGRVPSRDGNWDRVRTALAQLAQRPRTEDIGRLTADLRQTIASASAILRRLTALSPDETVAAVVGRLASHHDQFQIVIRPAYRGRLSRELKTPLHYLLGIDLLTGTGSTSVRPVTETQAFVADALRDDWYELGLHLRPGTPPEWPGTPRPAVVLQIPVIERPRTTEPSERLDVPAVGDKIVVLAPSYGYGELLAALLSEALGFDLADLRYREEPPHLMDLRSTGPTTTQRRAAREARERRAQRLLKQDVRHIAFGIAGGKTLASLEPELSRPDPDTALIAISYEWKWAARGRTIRGTPIKQQILNGHRAHDIAREWGRVRAAIAVRYDDRDVCTTSDATMADGDLIADVTVQTAIHILRNIWQVDPSDWRPGWLSHVNAEGKLDRAQQGTDGRHSEIVVHRPD